MYIKYIKYVIRKYNVNNNNFELLENMIDLMIQFVSAKRNNPNLFVFQRAMIKK